MITLFQSFGSENFAWLVAAAATLGLLLSIYRIKTRQLTKRIKEIQIAKNALKSHYTAVKVVLDDPAPSKKLKESLCYFSSAVTDREFGLHLASMLNDGAILENKISAEAKSLHKEKIDLGKTYEHLNKAFHTASEAGIVALFLRWPETVELFSLIASEIAADERKEESIARKATMFYRGNGNGNASGPMMAAV